LLGLASESAAEIPPSGRGGRDQGGVSRRDLFTTFVLDDNVFRIYAPAAILVGGAKVLVSAQDVERSKQVLAGVEVGESPITEHFLSIPLSEPAALITLLRKTRKTVAVSSAPPQGLASSFLRWRRAAAPFALLRNWLKKGRQEE
jgi:hypothetical protein